MAFQMVRQVAQRHSLGNCQAFFHYFFMIYETGVAWNLFCILAPFIGEGITMCLCWQIQVVRTFESALDAMTHVDNPIMTHLSSSVTQKRCVSPMVLVRGFRFSLNHHSDDMTRLTTSTRMTSTRTFFFFFLHLKPESFSLSTIQNFLPARWDRLTKPQKHCATWQCILSFSDLYCTLFGWMRRSQTSLHNIGGGGKGFARDV